MEENTLSDILSILEDKDSTYHQELVCAVENDDWFAIGKALGKHMAVMEILNDIENIDSEKAKKTDKSEIAEIKVVK